MKIYTKTGDEGQTGLANGKRVSKDHVRVDLYGTSDELNSCIGLALSLWQSQGGLPQDNASKSEALAEQIHAIQSLLFELGAELAGFPTEEGSILPADVDSIEHWIDEWNEELEEMKQFILPGGVPAAAQFHVCRTVCRRLERMLVGANASRDVEESEFLRHVGMVWINRLSDYLFVIGRLCNRWSDQPDIPWKSRMQRPSRSKKKD